MKRDRFKMKSKKKLLLIVCIVLCLATGIFGYQQYRYYHVYVDAVTEIADEIKKEEGNLNHCLNLYVEVWRNSIEQVEDSYTDVYTMYEGEFYQDFNDALDCLEQDEQYQKDMERVIAFHVALRKAKQQIDEVPMFGVNQKKASIFDEMVTILLHKSELLVNSFGYTYHEFQDELTALDHQLQELILESQAL